MKLRGGLMYLVRLSAKSPDYGCGCPVVPDPFMADLRPQKQGRPQDTSSVDMGLAAASGRIVGVCVSSILA